jgi:hypothetical protein
MRRLVKSRSTFMLIALGFLFTACPLPDPAMGQSSPAASIAAPSSSPSAIPSALPSASPSATPSPSPSVGIPTESPHVGLGWNLVGTAGFTPGTASYISLAVRNDCAPVIAFSDGTVSGAPSVMQYDYWTEGWKYLGSAGCLPNAITNPIILRLDSANTAYLAVKDRIAGNPLSIFVMKYSGNGATGWESVGENFGVCQLDAALSMDLNGLGMPYVVYQTSDYYASVMRYAGAALGWQNVGTNFEEYALGPYSIKFYGDDLYVGFLKGSGSSGAANVMKFTGAVGTGWEYIGNANFSGPKSQLLSIGNAGANDVYAAYRDDASGKKVSVKKFAGSGTTGWEFLGSGAFTDTIGDSLAFVTPYGSIVVAFTTPASGDKVTVMKYTGEGTTGWECLGDPVISDGPASHLSLAFDPNGFLYLAFCDGARGSKATVMKYYP